MKFIDLTGKIFDLWTIIKRDTENTKNKHPKWICQCQCGTIKSVPGNDLRLHKSTNCGCRKDQLAGNRARTHGMSGTKVYETWCRMIGRCENPKYEFFHRYGGRGIKICDRWRNSFKTFLADMGQPPSPKHSIDRIDNDGNYEPSNCQWVPLKKQTTNQTKTIRVTINGKETSLRNACKIKKLHYLQTYRQIKNGIPVEHFFKD